MNNYRNYRCSKRCKNFYLLYRLALKVAIEALQYFSSIFILFLFWFFEDFLVKCIAKCIIHIYLAAMLFTCKSCACVEVRTELWFLTIMLCVKNRGFDPHKDLNCCPAPLVQARYAAAEIKYEGILFHILFVVVFIQSR